MFFVWIIILFIGIVLTTVSYAGPKLTTSLCTGNNTNERLIEAS